MSIAVLDYQPKKRDGMTFGYLPDCVLPDLVPNLSGSAKIYSQEEVHNMMMQMDDGFVGMRRSTIDLRECVRQLILYIMVTKLIDDVLYVAVYQRCAGAEAKLMDGYSFGFGGHIESEDVDDHTYITESGEVVEATGTPSSFFSTLASGVRELFEEVCFFKNESDTKALVDLDSQIIPCGFVSDYKPEQPGFIGNTHLGVLGVVVVAPDLEFDVAEVRYSTIGWMTKQELLDNKGRFEAWSQLTMDVLDGVEELVRSEMKSVSI